MHGFWYDRTLNKLKPAPPESGLPFVRLVFMDLNLAEQVGVPDAAKLSAGVIDVLNQIIAKDEGRISWSSGRELALALTKSALWSLTVLKGSAARPVQLPLRLSTRLRSSLASQLAAISKQLSRTSTPNFTITSTR